MLTDALTLGFTATNMPKRTAFGMGSLVPAIGKEVAQENHAGFRRIDG